MALFVLYHQVLLYSPNYLNHLCALQKHLNLSPPEMTSPPDVAATRLRARNKQSKGILANNDWDCFIYYPFNNATDAFNKVVTSVLSSDDNNDNTNKVIDPLSICVDEKIHRLISSIINDV